MQNIHHQVSHPSPPEPAGPSRGEEPAAMTWVSLIRFLRRNLWILLLSSAGLALVAVLLASFIRQPRYEAVATLVIDPQSFRSDLKPRLLPVQGYQRLLESSSVVADTTQRLRAEGAVPENRSLRVGERLRTRIFVSRLAEETTLAPMIEVIALAPDPDEAAAIANTWSETFLDHARRIRRESVAPIISLIDEEYQKERVELLDLAVSEMEVANRYQERLDQLVQASERRLAEETKRTEALLADHKLETRRILEAFASDGGLRLAPDAPAAELEESVGEGTVPAELEGKLLQILSLRIRLAQTPRLLALEKAITDDSLWQSVALSETGMMELQPMLERRLVSQESNPVHQQLTLQLAEIEIDLEQLPPHAQREAQRFTGGLEALQLDRTVELTRLLTDRAIATDDLRRQASRELRAVERERRVELDQINADIAHQQSLFEKLAEARGEAGLAEAEQKLQEVRLGAPAVPPAAPEPRGFLAVALAAAFLGALLGLLICVVREVGPDREGPQEAT